MFVKDMFNCNLDTPKLLFVYGISVTSCCIKCVGRSLLTFCLTYSTSSFLKNSISGYLGIRKVGKIILM